VSDEDEVAADEAAMDPLSAGSLFLVIGRDLGDSVTIPFICRPSSGLTEEEGEEEEKEEEVEGEKKEEEEEEEVEEEEVEEEEVDEEEEEEKEEV